MTLLSADFSHDRIKNPLLCSHYPRDILFILELTTGEAPQGTSDLPARLDQTIRDQQLNDPTGPGSEREAVDLTWSSEAISRVL